MSELFDLKIEIQNSQVQWRELEKYNAANIIGTDIYGS